MKYMAEIFANGRFALIPESDYSEALEQGKEILVFCGGWSGGYARAFGANKERDYYSEDPNAYGYACYAYDVREKIFTPEQLTKFHRVIVTDGVRVYMKTGEPATAYHGGFYDHDTKYEDYVRRNYGASKVITQDEFEQLRGAVDKEMTIRAICGSKEEKEAIKEAISGYLY